MTDLTDESTVEEQYADESRLETRRQVWQPAEDGTNPNDLAYDTIAQVARKIASQDGTLRILEVGSGMGLFAERLKEIEGVETEVTAVDVSERMVELTAERGVDAKQGDVRDLPFEDESFDCVVAMWVLYHLDDPREALAELRRVVRPEGLLVVVTNGEGHLAELYGMVGDEVTPPELSFSTQNGDMQLRTFFEEVESTTIHTQAVFPDHAAAKEYLATLNPELAEQLPEFEGEKAIPGETTVFAATVGRPL